MKPYFQYFSAALCDDEESIALKQVTFVKLYVVKLYGVTTSESFTKLVFSRASVVTFS